MSDRIKGITIEIDGETTGLKQALSGVTKESISIQKELADVNRLLKFDPGNTEALAQKQELLSKQIETTSQKLKTLKDAQSQVDAQFASGKIGEEQYRAFQREIEFTEASLNKFKTAYKDAMNPPASGDLAKPIKDLEQEAEKSKGVFDNMGNYIKRGIGMAIGGDIWQTAKEGFGELITFGGDWQKSLNGLQAQTGATSEEMAQFNQQIEAVYNNNFGESVEDVAESFSQVRQYMQGTGEDLQAVTQNAIGFRDTFGVEVPESMRSVQALMKQFGLTSEEAFNLLAQGQQNGLNYSDELFDSFDEYSVQFNKLGLSATDMFDIFKSGTDAGAFNLDKVGDAVKEMSIRVIDGSTTTQQGFQALGLNATNMAQKFGAGGDSAKAAFYQVIQGLRDMDDPVQQSIAGVDLFGTQWEDLGPQVVTSLDSVHGAFDQTKNSMEQINQIKYNTPIEAMEGLGRQIETSVLLPVSQELMPSLNNAADQLSQTFASSDLKSGIESLSQGLGELIKTIVDIATNVLPSLMQGLGWIMDNANTIATGIVAIGTAMEVFKVASLINGVVTAFKDAQLATEGLTVAQYALNTAQKANIIGIIVAAVAGLVAAIVYLWNTNEGFRNAIIGIWEAIANAASTVWNGIVTFFTVTIPAAFQGFIDFVSNNWQELLLFIVNPFAGAFALLYNNFSGFREFVDGFIQSVKDFFINGWNTIATDAGNAWNSIVNVVTNAFNALQNFLDQAFPGLLEGISTAWEGIVEVVTNVWNIISTIIQGATTIIMDIITGNFGSIPQDIANIFANLGSELTAVWEGIKLIFSGAVEAIGAYLTAGFYALANILGEVVGSIASWGVQVWSYLNTNVPIWINGIVTFFTQLPGEILTWLTNTLTNIQTWGTDVLNYFTTNVPIWINDVVTYFSQLPDQIWTWLVNVVTNITTWGGNMLTEASTATTNTINGIVNYFTQLPGQIWSWLTQCVTDVGTWGSNMLTEASTGMTNVFNGIVDTFTNLPSRMTEIGTNIVAGIKQGILDAWEGMKSWIGGLCNSFIDGIKEKLDIHSPSRVMRELGNFTGEGFGLGIGDTIGSISKQANALADAATPNINSGSYDMNINSTPAGSNSISTSSNLDEILNKMDALVETFSNMGIYFDTTKVGKVITPEINKNMSKATKDNNRSLGRSNLSYV